jgi:hypothetical protein
MPLNIIPSRYLPVVAKAIFIDYCLGYSQDELKILYDMVDVVKNNPNQYTLAVTTKDRRLKFRPGLYSLVDLITTVAVEGDRIKLQDFIKKTPLDEMPLYINSPDPFCLIAKWRLYISK